MTFDFTKAIADAEGELNSTTTMSIVLGPSGSGKSSLAGTFELPTLYIYTDGESHGPEAAKALGKDTVLPVCLSREGDRELNADESYSRLINILQSVTKEQFGAVVIDGMTELETILRKTSQFKKDCINSKGKHDAFEEPKVVMDLLRPILGHLRSLKKKGVHSLVTCILEVSSLSDTGEILESKPKLSTYSVVESVIQAFPDVFTVGRMVKEGKNGVVQAHRIQFLSGVARNSKDAMGVVKKCINYHPRITGVIGLPGNVAAKMTEIIKLKLGETK